MGVFWLCVLAHEIAQSFSHSVPRLYEEGETRFTVRYYCRQHAKERNGCSGYCVSEESSDRAAFVHCRVKNFGRRCRSVWNSYSDDIRSDSAQNKSHVPVRHVLRITITGTTVKSHIVNAKNKVRGRMGCNRSPTRPRDPLPPACMRDAKTARPQLKIAEYTNVRKSSRWRRTDLTRGSYICDAGGTVGAAREANVEGNARIAVDDLKALSAMDVVVGAGGKELPAFLLVERNACSRVELQAGVSRAVDARDCDCSSQSVVSEPYKLLAYGPWGIIFRGNALIATT